MLLVLFIGSSVIGVFSSLSNAEQRELEMLPMASLNEEQVTVINSYIPDYDLYLGNSELYPENDAMYKYLGLDRIRMEGKRGDDEIVIAVLDHLVDWKHVELESSIPKVLFFSETGLVDTITPDDVDEWNAGPYSSLYDDYFNPTSDEFGHGTGVAGVVHQIIPEAKIIPCALDFSSTAISWYDQFVNFMDWLHEYGETAEYNIDIVTCSVFCPLIEFPLTTLQDKITDVLRDTDIFISWAPGNFADPDMMIESPSHLACYVDDDLTKTWLNDIEGKVDKSSNEARASGFVSVSGVCHFTENNYREITINKGLPNEEIIDYHALVGTRGTPDNLLVYDIIPDGPCAIKLTAPMFDIYTTFPMKLYIDINPDPEVEDYQWVENPNPYIFYSGTSFATPLLAGIAGLVKTDHSTYDSQDIEEKLTLTSVYDSNIPYDPSIEGERVERLQKYGYGMVCPLKALGLVSIDDDNDGLTNVQELYEFHSDPYMDNRVPILDDFSQDLWTHNNPDLIYHDASSEKLSVTTQSDLSNDFSYLRICDLPDNFLLKFRFNFVSSEDKSSIYVGLSSDASVYNEVTDGIFLYFDGGFPSDSVDKFRLQCKVNGIGLSSYIYLPDSSPSFYDVCIYKKSSKIEMMVFNPYNGYPMYDFKNTVFDFSALQYLLVCGRDMSDPASASCSIDDLILKEYDPDEDPDSDGISTDDELEIWNTNPYDDDSDNDLMDDGWETTFYTFTNPCVSDGDLDPDGDGWNNLQEYLYSTDPGDSESYPESYPKFSFEEDGSGDYSWTATDSPKDVVVPNYQYYGQDTIFHYEETSHIATYQLAQGMDLDLTYWSGITNIRMAFGFRCQSNYAGSSVTQFRLFIYDKINEIYVPFSNPTSYNHYLVKQNNRNGQTWLSGKDSNWQQESFVIDAADLSDYAHTDNQLCVRWGHVDSWSTDWYQRQYLNYLTIEEDTSGELPPEDEPTPNAPRDLIGVGDTFSQITLAWKSPLNVKATQYKIYKKIGSSYEPFATIAHLGDIDTFQFWTDTGLSLGVTYYYRVAALNLQGIEGPYSSWSGTVGSFGLSNPINEVTIKLNGFPTTKILTILFLGLNLAGLVIICQRKITFK